MLKRSKAFTLVETLTVIAIILVLASLGYYVSAPSREVARQSVCISQLRQIYNIAQLYASDHDGGEGYPELHGLVYMPPGGRNPIDQLKEYGMTKELMFCPSSSSRMRKALSSTYLWPIQTNPNNADGTMSDARKYMIELEKKVGTRLSIVECHIHDELYYATSEDHDPALATPFRIRLFVDGSVVRKRVSPPRTFIFTDMAYQ